MVTAPQTGVKYVYFFGGGNADGNGNMKDVLGRKRRRIGGNDQRRAAGSAGLHHSNRSLPRIHANRQEFRWNR